MAAAGWQARAIIETPVHGAVGFDLGLVEVFPAAEEADRLEHLGPDLLGPDWDAAEAVRRLAAEPDVPIAVALGEQRNLAGLGNVYVNEVCFLRGIRPDRPTGEVDLPPLVDLASRVIRANRDRIARTTTGDTRRGERLWVYARGGEPCRRCGTRIEHGGSAATTSSCATPGGARTASAERGARGSQLTGPVHFSPGPWPIGSGMTDASRNASWSERRPSRSERACMSLISGAPAVMSPRGR